MPKRNGGSRTIYLPDYTQKRELRSIVGVLSSIADRLDTHDVIHGFTQGRSSVTNAKVHIGYEFTICFDLSDFFESVTREKCRAAAAVGGQDERLFSILHPDCFPDGAARQGLPTSPALANIAATVLDNAIMALWKPNRFHERPWVFTRYADDLSFSCHTMATVNLLLATVPGVVEACGFKVNPSKTRVQCARAGRRIVTGVAVGERDIVIPRAIKRRIRAGRHQLKTNKIGKRMLRRMRTNAARWRRNVPIFWRLRCSVQGLKEWARLKAPKDSEPKSSAISAVVNVTAMVVTAVAGKAAGVRFKAFARGFI